MSPAFSAESSVSVENDVDAILLRDPRGAYGSMDDRSRADYQRKIITLAGRSRRSAHETAQVAIDLAVQASVSHGASDRRSHVGYYLIDDGIAELAAALQIKLTWWERSHRRSSSGLLLAYYALIFLICSIYGSGSILLFEFDLPWVALAFLALLMTMYASSIAEHWINMLLPYLLQQPERIPRLDFTAGIPKSFHTLVVVPCLLTSRDGIQKLAQSLEKLRENNPGAGAGYVLLSDFLDAPTEQTGDDGVLLQEACVQISALNERHDGGFVLLHRPRRWNPSEESWIGWERKRGKLEELNAYLLGGTSPFQIMHGDLDIIAGVKYVVTLDDNNSNLTPGSIQELAGAIAHPLNRAVLNEDGSRVVAGYGVLQPRNMLMLAKDSTPSRLELLVHSLIELETSEAFRSNKPAVDIDQDVFRQVSYAGKGIYEIEVFHRLTHGRIVENTVLSHDVLEGGMVRAGCVSDLILLDPLPPTLHSYTRRNHRWFRGDWQLLPWLLPTVRSISGGRVKNSLPLFGRCKIFYNLIRMMLPATTLLCFVIGWATSATPGLWTLYLLAIAWVPAIVGLLLGVARNLRFGRFRGMGRGILSWLSLRPAGLIFAAHEAYTTLDAGARVGYRMLISRRKLLEWTASSVASTRQDPTLIGYLKLMWFSPAFAITVIGFIVKTNPSALPSVIAFSALWLAAPAIAWWWSQTPRDKVYSVQPMQP